MKLPPSDSQEWNNDLPCKTCFPNLCIFCCVIQFHSHFGKLRIDEVHFNLNTIFLGQIRFGSLGSDGNERETKTSADTGCIDFRDNHISVKETILAWAPERLPCTQMSVSSFTYFLGSQDIWLKWLVGQHILSLLSSLMTCVLSMRETLVLVGTKNLLIATQSVMCENEERYTWAASKSFHICFSGIFVKQRVQIL